MPHMRSERGCPPVGSPGEPAGLRLSPADAAWPSDPVPGPGRPRWHATRGTARHGNRWHATPALCQALATVPVGTCVWQAWFGGGACRRLPACHRDRACVRGERAVPPPSHGMGGCRGCGSRSHGRRPGGGRGRASWHADCRGCHWHRHRGSPPPASGEPFSLLPGRRGMPTEDAVAHALPPLA